MTSDSSVDRKTTTDEDGAYRIALPPGTYEVSAEADGMMGGCETNIVQVKTGRFTRSDIPCDTGIR